MNLKSLFVFTCIVACFSVQASEQQPAPSGTVVIRYPDGREFRLTLSQLEQLRIQSSRFPRLVLHQPTAGQLANTLRNAQPNQNQQQDNNQ